eukprot:TRINITY_DN3852_c0_g1_i2.p1 TRINITY_DN3852_c0_g1~~TRINITY_DN3852_c0_g1_i2.p1  ORF type:complete len:291 (-),score=65.93 TRINITY_DN3852_c0_g1_i2:2211-3083(-)
MYTFDSEKFAQQLQMSIREALNAPRKALCIKLENLRSNLHTMLIKALLPARDEAADLESHFGETALAKFMELEDTVNELLEETHWLWKQVLRDNPFSKLQDNRFSSELQAYELQAKALYSKAATIHRILIPLATEVHRQTQELDAPQVTADNNKPPTKIAKDKLSLDSAKEDLSSFQKSGAERDQGAFDQHGSDRHNIASCHVDDKHDLFSNNSISTSPQEQLHHKQDRTMAKAALLANSIANLAETTTQILLIPTSRAAEPVERGSNPEENPTAASTEDELLATASPDD